jgi:hypothetical protein
MSGGTPSLREPYYPAWSSTRTARVSSCSAAVKWSSNNTCVAVDETTGSTRGEVFAGGGGGHARQAGRIQPLAEAVLDPAAQRRKRSVAAAVPSSIGTTEERPFQCNANHTVWGRVSVPRAPLVLVFCGAAHGRVGAAPTAASGGCAPRLPSPFPLPRRSERRRGWRLGPSCCCSVRCGRSDRRGLASRRKLAQRALTSPCQRIVPRHNLALAAAPERPHARIARFHRRARHQ